MKYLMAILLLTVQVSVCQSDSFDKIKENLKRDGCYYYEFYNIVESDIFDIVDTTYGTAYLASDGRYYVTIGDDSYLYDRDHLYSYSALNNQVVIEKVLSANGYNNEEFLFVSRLDELYKSYAVKEDSIYRLVKKQPEIKDNNPDSMVVEIDNKQHLLKQIDYFDVNEELNHIIFLKQDYYQECAEDRFLPDFPDNAERIKL